MNAWCDLCNWRGNIQACDQGASNGNETRYFSLPARTAIASMLPARGRGMKGASVDGGNMSIRVGTGGRFLNDGYNYKVVQLQVIL